MLVLLWPRNFARFRRKGREETAMSGERRRVRRDRVAKCRLCGAPQEDEELSGVFHERVCTHCKVRSGGRQAARVRS